LILVGRDGIEPSTNWLKVGLGRQTAQTVTRPH